MYTGAKEYMGLKEYARAKGKGCCGKEREEAKEEDDSKYQQLKKEHCSRVEEWRYYQIVEGKNGSLTPLFESWEERAEKLATEVEEVTERLTSSRCIPSRQQYINQIEMILGLAKNALGAETNFLLLENHYIKEASIVNEANIKTLNPRYKVKDEDVEEEGCESNAEETEERNLRVLRDDHRQEFAGESSDEEDDEDDEDDEDNSDDDDEVDSDDDEEEEDKEHKSDAKKAKEVLKAKSKDDAKHKAKGDAEHKSKGDAKHKSKDASKGNGKRERLEKAKEERANKKPKTREQKSPPPKTP